MTDKPDADPNATTNRILQEMADWRHRSDLCNAKSKAAIMPALAAAGIVTVTVVFDGYADSGAVERIDVAGLVADLPDVVVDVFRARWSADEPELATAQPLKDAIENLTLSFVTSKHTGWENNEGAYGEVVFDVRADLIHLDYNERFTDAVNHTYQL